MIRKAWNTGIPRFLILLLLFACAVWGIGKRFAATEIPRLYAAELEAVSRRAPRRIPSACISPGCPCSA